MSLHSKLVKREPPAQTESPLPLPGLKAEATQV